MTYRVLFAIMEVKLMMGGDIVKLRDSFGNIYEANILPIHILEEKFFEKSMRDIIEMAWENYVPELRDGVVYFDLTDGSFIAASLGTGEGLIRQAHLVKVYDIPKNFEGTWFTATPEEFFYPDDLERVREILIKEGVPEDEVEYAIDELGVEGVVEKLNMSEEEFTENMISYLMEFENMGELWDIVEKNYWKLLEEKEL